MALSHHMSHSDSQQHECKNMTYDRAEDLCASELGLLRIK